MLGLLFGPKGAGSTFLGKVGGLVPNHKVLSVSTFCIHTKIEALLQFLPPVQSIILEYVIIFRSIAGDWEGLESSVAICKECRTVKVL